ncbi:sugar ABC transporter ATP-binding protein [Inquilinus sp. YAF38]|uniref:sugar ABC transporter ATP-binding protein n=1 Tax=Inquilinus sp. YAF38 TaxID=3233084 RepID=UPI003F909B08
MAPPARLGISNLSRSFPGVKALDSVSFEVAAGEVHGLLGENGAGKSTLLKILSGVQMAEFGEIRIDGAVVAPTSPVAARRAGIAMIHQELQQVPELTVVQTMFLGRQLVRAGLFVDRAAQEARCRTILAGLDPGIDPAARIRDLTVARRQLVEIGRALLDDARIIAMDEPTSSLTPAEFERLAEVIANLRARGVAVIYVSHKLDEVKRVCSRATVLRDGRVVGRVDLAGTTIPVLVSMMVGRDLAAAEHSSFVQPQTLLSVRGFGRGAAVSDVGFDLRAGEVLGIAGLVGSGRTELLRLIAGADRPSAGSMVLDGKPFLPRSPRAAIAAGIGLVPEERKRDGIVPLRPIASNVAIATLGRFTIAGCIHRSPLRAAVTALVQRMALRPLDIDRPIRLFSGGNQQKAIIARWLAAEARILLFDEPTRGIDVGAKAEIYGLIEQFAREGRAVIVVSSDMMEILRVSDRVLVMRAGAAAAMLDRAELSEEAIMRHAVPVSAAALKEEAA